MPRTPSTPSNHNNHNKKKNPPPFPPLSPIQPAHHAHDATQGPTSSAGDENSKEVIKDMRKKEGFDVLPTELISHVLAHLDPDSLHQVQLVCKRFRTLVADDSSWRDAFGTYYGIPTGSTMTLGRRLEPSCWKAEYIGRVWLNTRWVKSRTSSLLHDPHLGAISYIHVSLPPAAPLGRPRLSSLPRSPAAPSSVLSVSLPFGRSAISDPFTGKARKPLSASPVDNFGFALHPNLPLLATTSFAVSPDASRVIWGMQDGSVRILDTSVPTNSTQRAWATAMDDRGDRVRSVVGHASNVLAVSYPQSGDLDCWASVGEDGRVAVWSFKPLPSVSGNPVRLRESPIARKVWEAGTSANGLVGSVLRSSSTSQIKACALAFNVFGGEGSKKRFNVVAGLTDGVILVWLGAKVDLEGPAWQINSVVGEASPVRLAGPSSPVDTLVLDFNSNSLSILAHHLGLPSFSKHSFTLDSCDTSSVVFGHKQDHLGPLTAFATDFRVVASTPSVPRPPPAVRVVSSVTPKVTPFLSPSRVSISPISTLTEETGVSSLQGMNRFGKTKFVVAGDKEGRVFIWNWEEDVREKRTMLEVIEPTKMIQGFSTKVTSLAVTETSILVGSLDGALRCYDTLTSTLLRTFKDRAASRLPARMLNAGLIDDESSWRVSMIHANRDSVVAAVGGKILSWRIVEEPKKRKNKTNGKMSARTERGRSDFELRREVRESLSSLSAESDMRLSRLRQETRLAQEFGLPPSLDNMTEDEAIAFAVMLSVEEQEARFFSDSDRSSLRTSPAFGPLPEDELFELDALSLNVASPSYRLQSASDPDTDSDTQSAPSRSGWYTRDLSLPPFARGATSSSGTPSPSRSWKPAWRPSLNSPQSQAHDNAKIVVSPRLGPVYGSGAEVSDGLIPDMSEELWPVAGPSAHAPAALSVSRRGWNDVARAASSPPASSHTPISFLTTQLRGERSRGGAEAKFVRQEEEDLRCALELSLAEEASRLS